MGCGVGVGWGGGAARGGAELVYDGAMCGVVQCGGTGRGWVWWGGVRWGGARLGGVGWGGWGEVEWRVWCGVKLECGGCGIEMNVVWFALSVGVVRAAPGWCGVLLCGADPGGMG